MSWTLLNFGKHQGKTLPQVILSDPDWFFWAIEDGVFAIRPNLRGEAEELNRKARHIKIPNSGGAALQAEYLIHHPSGKFSHFDIVPADQSLHEGSSPAFRRDVIDMSIPRQIAPYDKLGCKELVKSVKLHVFGNTNARLTKSKCESFFSDDSNFA